MSAPRTARRDAPAPGRARAGRTATLCSTASDEAATALMPAFLAGTLAASPIVLGVIEGLASVADGQPCSRAGRSPRTRGGAAGSAPTATP